jgi:Glycosyltransferase family 9 (heptosyltransferase)
MGIGDEVLATGFARGAAVRGKRIAFGDGQRLIWGPWCAEAFRGNPNIATRADEPGVEWIAYYKGHRGYNSPDAARRRWIWNYDFKPLAGEFFFDAAETTRTLRRPGAVLIEPNVPWHKSVAVNKDWGRHRYQQLADQLRTNGWRVLQTSHGKVRLQNVETIQVNSFRDAAAVVASVDLAIVPEGGLHHAAAAVGTQAIVIHGGFTPPAVLGYQGHINLTGGAEACGNWHRCAHCRAALDRIEVEDVYIRANTVLHQRNETTPERAVGISELHSGNGRQVLP